MMYGVYHGPHIELLGKRAIVRDPEHIMISGRRFSPSVLAQFDFSGDTMNERNDGGPLNYLCFGWHPFARSNFTLYPESNFAEMFEDAP